MKRNLLICVFTFAAAIAYGQTFVVRHQTFLDKDNKALQRYDAYDLTKPDVIILVQIDAAILSIKVGNSYVGNSYMLSEIRKTDKTTEVVDVYTFQATDNQNNGVQTFTLSAQKRGKQAILEIPHDNALIAKVRLDLIELERNEMSLLELYK